MMKKHLKIGLISVVLIGLFVNLGLSMSVTTDKNVYYCSPAKVCEPVKVTIDNDKLGVYSVKFSMDTKDGVYYTSKLPYLSTAKNNEITINSLSASLGKNTFSWNVSATGQIKFSVRVYDSLGKLVGEIDPWFNDSCAYKRQLNYTNVGAEALINFPVLVVLNSSVIDYGDTDANDIRFYDENGVRLDKEIEWWNSTANSYIWYRDPNVSSNTDYAFMYYKCTDEDTNLASAVWDSKFDAVYHFTGSASLIDSTINDNDGTNTGTASYCVNNPIGCEYSFAGDEYSSVPVASYIAPLGSADRTESAFLRITNNNGDHPFLGYGTHTFEKMNVLHATVTNGYFSFGGYGASSDYDTTTSITTGVYNLATMVYSGNATMSMYNNTALIGSNSKTLNTEKGTNNLHIGANDVIDGTFKGNITELRIENVARSGSWINATWFNLGNKFIIWGEQEIPPAPEYLNITYLNPDNLNITDINNVNFSVIVNSSETIDNCTLNINSSTWGMLNATSPIANNSVVSWFIYLANDTYTFNMSCLAGVLFNSTPIYILYVQVPNITEPEEPEAPPENYTGITHYSCLSNTTLYSETSYTLDGVNHTRTENINCPYGCNLKANVCNPSTFDAWVLNGEILVGALVALLLIFMAGRKAKGIRF
jgi:hypothetical protein